MKSAYYQASNSEFLKADPAAILGELARSHGFALEQAQRDAWIEQIETMKQALQELDCGHILFEFTIPRMGKRADVVLVFGCAIVVVEFKVRSTTFDRHAVEQVHDYALDLKNFHRGSHALCIIPILVATQAKFVSPRSFDWAADGVADPMLVNADQLKSVLAQAAGLAVGHPIDFSMWISSGYQPTPTIVEAAQALYQAHGVEEIARSDAGAQNLGITCSRIAEIIEHSKTEHRKSICFVTGVPGAGKTLVRSSFYCGEVASEFDVQGLELDWAGVCWDADFRYSDSRWSHLNFRGTRWQQVNAAERQLYLKNAYRVILTRARQGMIIFVPQGSDEDPTRLPAFYDQTFHFLQACGLRMLDVPLRWCTTEPDSHWGRGREITANGRPDEPVRQ